MPSRAIGRVGDGGWVGQAIAYPGMGYDFVVNITTAIPVTIVAPQPRTPRGSPSACSASFDAHELRRDAGICPYALPFLDTYRTMCLAPEPPFRAVLEENRVWS
jgi:hypothetical protein